MSAFHLQQSQPVSVNYNDVISEVVALSNPHVFSYRSDDYNRSVTSLTSQVRTMSIHSDELTMYRNVADNLTSNVTYDITSDTDGLLDILLKRNNITPTYEQRIFTISISNRSSDITPEIAVLVSNAVHLHSEVRGWTLRSMNDTLLSDQGLGHVFSSITISRRVPKSFNGRYILFDIVQPDRREILGRYVHVILKSNYGTVF